ncbi:MAG: hypothetical protein Q7R30_13595 [Acidobacteriota bacterium]|nr:hypothetical protein [Acidobacteriota bacterium]
MLTFSDQSICGIVMNVMDRAPLFLGRIGGDSLIAPVDFSRAELGSEAVVVTVLFYEKQWPAVGEANYRQVSWQGNRQAAMKAGAQLLNPDRGQREEAFRGVSWSEAMTKIRSSNRLEPTQASCRLWRVHR